MREKFKGMPKKVITTFIMTMLALFSGILAACGNDVNKLSFSISKPEVVIYLGESENNAEKIIVEAKGANDSVLKDLHVHIENNIISTSSQTYLGNGKTELVFKANSTGSQESVSHGTALVTVSSKQNASKNISFKVVVVDPVQQIVEKVSDFKKFVLRGGQTAVDNSLIEFIPNHTALKQVSFDIVNNPSPEHIKLENGRLSVLSSLPQYITSIQIKAVSQDRDINPVLMDFDILSPITRDMITLKTINEEEILNSESAIYLAHNSGLDASGFAQEGVKIKLDANANPGKGVKIEYVLENQTAQGAFAQVVSTLENVSSREYTVNLRAGNVLGNAKLYFKISYEGYDYTYSTESFKTEIFSYDMIKNIYINDELAPQRQEMLLFTNYASQQEGVSLKLEVSPNTVASKHKAFYLETFDYVPNNPNGTNKITIYTKGSNGALTPLEYNEKNQLKVVEGQEVVIRAVNGVSVQTAEILFRTVFSEEFLKGQDFSQEATVVFNIKKGVSSAEWVYTNGEVQPDFILDSTTSIGQGQQKVYFTVSPADAEVLSFASVVAGSSFTVSNIRKETTLDGNDTSGYSALLTSKAQKAQVEETFAINFGNGRRLSSKVKLVVPFKEDDLIVSSQTNLQSTSVGYYKQEDNGFAFNTAIKVGSSVNYSINLPKDSYSVEYSFFDALPNNLEYENWKYKNLPQIENLWQKTFSPNSTVINAVDLKAFGLLTSNKVGKVIVKAEFSGKVINSLGKYNTLEETEQSKIVYFYVEVYLPVTSFTVNTNSVDLYSLESVGYFNRTLAQATLKLTVNYGTATPTYQKIEVTDEIGLKGYRANMDEVAGRTNEFLLTVLRTKPVGSLDGDIPVYSGYITFTIQEFNRSITQRVRVTIRNVEKVKGIEVYNVNEETGIYLESTSNQSFIIDAGVTNQNAYNKNLRYIFEPSIGTAPSILSVTETNGLIKVVQFENGGTGIIKIVPEDAYIINELGQPQIADGNKVYKVIKITVADGKSRETAKRISTEAQLKNLDPTFHYVITNNIEVSNFATLQNFSGGLYSLLDGETVFAINFVGNNNGSLFGNIELGGIVQDLILTGNVNGSGFIASQNNGKIENVIIDTQVLNRIYAPSVLTSTSTNIGGLVGVNGATGQILNSHFYGSISATGESNANVGGLVGQNLGKISGSSVEFYRFENNSSGEVYSSIISQAGYVGGIAGQLSGGQVENSYVYSYHTKQALGGTIVGALFGRVSNLQSRVENVFARVNASVYAGDQLSNENNAHIGFNLKNAYLLSYNPTNSSEKDKYSIVNSANTLYVNTKTLFEGSSVVIADYSSKGINLTASTSVWSISYNINQAYPFLKNVRNQEINNAILQNVKMKNSANVLIDEVSATAVMFLYEKLDSVNVTAEEASIIKSWNTISFATLFSNFENNSLKVKVLGTSSHIKTGANSLELNSVGKVDLEVFSRFDYSIRKTYTVYVLYKIDAIKVYYSGEVLEDGSIITVKSGTTQVFSVSSVVSRVVKDRIIEFKQNNGLKSSLNSDFPNTIVSATTNVHSVDTSNFGSENEIEYVVTSGFESGSDFWNANEILNEYLSSGFTIATYKGAFEISTNIKEIIKIMPHDTVVFDVQTLTDYQNEKLEVKVFDQTSNLYLVDNILYREIFEFEDDLLSLAFKDSFEFENNKFRNTYSINLSVKDDYKDYNFNGLQLTLEVSSKDAPTVFAVVTLVIDSQIIEHINITSREAYDWNNQVGYIFKSEPNNLIAPGHLSLLSIDIFPAISYFNRLEIVSSVENGQKVMLDMFKYGELPANVYPKADGKQGFYKIQSGFTAIENGISINKANLSKSQSGQVNLSSLYVGAQIPSKVAQNTNFEITVTAYGANNEVLYTSNFILVVQPLLQPKITVNGQESVVVARGTTSTLEIALELDQNLAELKIEPVYVNEQPVQVYGVTIQDIKEEENLAQRKKIYTISLYVSELTKFSGDSQSFSVVATVNRMLGNIYEESSASVTITVVDFLIDESSFKVDTFDPTSHIFETYVGVTKPLEFTFDTTSWERYGSNFLEYNEAIDDLERQVELFKKYNYLYSESMINSNFAYILNYNAGDTASFVYKNFINNLYYVNANGTSTKVVAGNGIVPSQIVSFEYSMRDGAIRSNLEEDKELSVIGLRTGEQKMRLVFNYKTPDTPINSDNVRQFTYDFTIKITTYTDEENPRQIYTAEEFLNIQNEQQEMDYILMQNIELYEYVPFATTKIKSFDGNNKVITIMSFDMENEGTASSIALALFTSVTANSTIKNVIVNYYHINNIVINTARFKTISIAGFAIENNGIITNSQVLAQKVNVLQSNTSNSTLGLLVVYTTGTTGTIIPSNISSTIAGFVLTNAGTGTITNSRVGGEELKLITNLSHITGSSSTTTYKLSPFVISGQGNIAGFVYSNSGVVSSSFASNIGIENVSAVDRQTVSAGFVGHNSGSVALSYSKGSYNTAYPNEIRTTGWGIATSSVGTGFAYLNTGSIFDSYSNIMIKNRLGNAGSYSAGFVYNNQGNIEKAYASSVIENEKSTQMAFTGLDQHGNLLNSGTITNSYYYAPLGVDNEDEGDTEKLYASGVLKVDSFTNTEIFYGFSFATIGSNDGVWTMSAKGLDLISANDIAISSRYFTGNMQLHYTYGYEYGSVKNPIIIRNAKEFNDVFGLSTYSNIQKFFDLTQKTVFGHYRLVANIDLSELATGTGGEYKLSSSEMKLINGASLDGNNLKVSNLELISSVNSTLKYFGMFSRLEDGSIIKNLNVSLIGVSASNIQHVGAIAGGINNSKIVNINLVSQTTSQSAIVLGQNVVGGIVGLVNGDSTIVSLTTTRISVVADYFNNFTRQVFLRKEKLDNYNNSALSYAGGIAGIVDIFTQEMLLQVEYTKDKLMSFANSSALHVMGSNQIRGGTVGGVLGYAGQNLNMRDLAFEVVAEATESPQKLVSYSYAAGGLIGELYGDLTQSKIEHSSAIQKQIEENLSNYYTTNQQVQRGNLTLFVDAQSNYKPLFVGGLVGQMFSGEISNSYAKVNVLATNAVFAGGIVGSIGDFYLPSSAIKTIGDVKFTEVYFFGDLRSSGKSFLLQTTIGEKAVSSSAGAVFGFVQYIMETRNLLGEKLSLSIDGVNAIAYLSKATQTDEIIVPGDKNTFKNIYDFYARTFINGNFVDASELPQGISLMNLAEGEENQNSQIPLNYVTSHFASNVVTYYLRKSIHSNVGGAKYFENKIVSLSEIKNIGQDGTYMDIIFRNNNWDPLKWERNSNELLPRIVFTVSSSVFYIRTAEDFALMRKYPDKTFIIIGSGVDGENQVLIDMSGVTDKDFSGDNAIKGFSGVLKGYMPPKENSNGEKTKRIEPLFGFANLGLSVPLIESARNGAVFADFIIANSNYNSLNKVVVSDAAILVGKAYGTMFNNLKINNSTLKTESPNAGLLVGTAENSMFDTMLVEYSNSNHLVEQNITTGKTEFSAGIIAGTVSSSIKTTFKNIRVNVNSSGVKVNGRTLNANLPAGEATKVNIGTYFGKSSQGTVEIISTVGQESDFIKRVYLEFVGSESSIFSDLYIVNAGGFGGQVQSANMSFPEQNKIIDVIIKLSGQFYSSSKSLKNALSPSVAAGGLFGEAIGENISWADLSKTLTVKPDIQITNHYLAPENNQSKLNAYVGGVVGYSTSSVNIKNVQIAETRDVRSSSNYLRYLIINENQNKAVIGGVIGGATNMVTVEDVSVNGEAYTRISNASIATYGGILGYYNDGTDSGILSSITKSINNSKVKIEGSKSIYAGGLVGSVNLNITTSQPDGTAITVGGNYFGGEINLVKTVNATIEAGGAVGTASLGANVSKELGQDKIDYKKVVVDGNKLHGDISLETEVFDGIDNITLGGVVGIGTKGTVITNNKVLTTLFANALSASSIGEKTSTFSTDAIVGNDKYNTTQENYYVSQINLATSTTPGSLNLLYKDIFTEKYKYGDAKITLYDGHKLQPFTVSNLKKAVSSEDKSSLFNQNGEFKTIGNNNYRQYFQITANADFELPAMTLDESKFNFAFIGDGYTITLKNSDQRLFNIIDGKSFVSGLKLATDDTIGYATPFENYTYTYGALKITQDYPLSIYGALTAVNHGVIFGSGVTATEKTDFSQYSKEYYAKIILSNTTLAGGLVGFNKGRIADSFSNVEIINITDLTTKEVSTSYNLNWLNGEFVNKFVSAPYVEDSKTKIQIRPMTSGFVGLNEGSIYSSYSSGTINAFSSIVYAFGADNQNIKYKSSLSNSSISAVVRKSFTILKASNAFTNTEIVTVNKIQTVQTTLEADVFGSGANSSNYYDVFATQVSDVSEPEVDNEDKSKKLLTRQMNLITRSKQTPHADQIAGTNFEYVVTANFGYPSFGKAYEGENFDFMRNVTSNVNDYLISNLGVLQELKTVLENDATKNIYLLNDFEITKDMGLVSSEIDGFTQLNTLVPENWNSFALSKTNVFGNDFSISNFKALAKVVRISLNGDEIIRGGFFTTLTSSSIRSLTLSNGEVVSDLPNVYLGAFAGNMISSSIINSKNLGTVISSNNGGIAGGIVGEIVSSNQNQKIENTISTGNVISQGGSGDALVGGIAGIINGTSQYLIDNKNYGFLYATGNSAVEAYGIGKKAGLDENVTDGAGNFNFGSMRTEKGEDINLDGTMFDIFGGETKSSGQPTNPNNKITSDDTSNLKGNGTKEKPYLIYTYEDFAIALNEYKDGDEEAEFNVLFMENIDLNASYIYQGITDLKTFLKGNIFGNNKLLSYILSYHIPNSDANEPGLHLINALEQNSQISNLKVLGLIGNSYVNNSLFINENNGIIKQVDVYGSILKSGKDINKANDTEETYLAGLAITNKGEILHSNNYALIISNDGKDAKKYVSEGNETEAGSASRIGGIAANVLDGAKVLASNNYGALIAGNGGEGYGRKQASELYDGKDRRTNKQEGGYTNNVNGANGVNGLSGGHASVLGGVVAKVENITNKNLTISGNNFGILIGGKGGDGGAGGHGGNGGNGDFAKSKTDLFAKLAINSSSKDLNKNLRGGDGGNGGEGGHGGSSILGNSVGIGNALYIENQNSSSTIFQSISIAGKEGLGGNGGNGGNGGKGVLDFKEDHWYHYYTNAGNGGNGGNAGLNGNSKEMQKITVNLANSQDIYKSIPNTDSRKGVIGEHATKHDKEIWSSRPEIAAAQSLIIAGFATPFPGDEIAAIAALAALMTELEIISEVNYNNAKAPAGGVGGTPLTEYVEINNRTVGVSSKGVDRDEDGNFLPQNWYELVDAIWEHNADANGSEDIIYFLPENNSDTIFDSNNKFAPLPAFKGTVDFKGSTIKIKDDYDNFEFLPSGGKIKNLNLVLDIDKYETKLDDQNQLLNNSGKTVVQENVSISGNIEYNITDHKYKWKFASRDENNEITEAAIPNAPGITFAYQTSALNLSGGLYQINSDAAFAEFVELANLGANWSFNLNNNNDNPSNGAYSIDEATGSYLINQFNGTLTSNVSGKAKIHLEPDARFASFVAQNNGTIKNLQFTGGFTNSGVANINNGTIENVNIQGMGEILSINLTNDELSSSIYGISQTNYGIIKNVENRHNLTAGTNGNAAGIVGSNYGTIENAQNYGTITAGKGADATEGVAPAKGGDAAGIAIYNGSVETNQGTITNAQNYGDVTAGAGGNNPEGLLDENNIVFDGAQGGNAAGIVVYNYLVDINRDAEEPVTITLYGKLVASSSAIIGNDATITAGAGGTNANGGDAGLIIAINSDGNGNGTYTDYTDYYIQNGTAIAGDGGNVYNLTFTEP